MITYRLTLAERLTTSFATLRIVRRAAMVVTTTDPSSGSNAPGGGVDVTLDTGHVRVQGYAPTVVVGSAYASAAAAIREWREAAVQAPATDASEVLSPTDADEVLSSIARGRVSKREAAVLELEPRFQALSNAILHLIVEGVEPARPHVGNPDFSEDMLQAFARYEQEQREAKRLRESAKQDRRVSFIEKIALLVIGGIVTLGLKALFFPSP
jgi:hypothetical protein